ncbi:MAG: metallophosphoesterase family protein [Planctomycetota bacterium]
MKLLHTADWHLADRLKQIDRTADLRRNVERIAGYCDQESVDVLLIAGDLFSDLAKPDALQSSLAHLSHTFRPFLLRGGTIVAIAGNHDRDIYCETLRRAFQLAAPNLARPGDTLPAGRFYLINKPVHFRLRDGRQRAVSFVCMPYPTAARYLRGGSAGGYSGFDERSRLLRQTFLQQLRSLYQQLGGHQPRVLVAHANAVPWGRERLFRCGLEEDIVVDDPAVTTGWSYVALGHLHGPGMVNGLSHVRYSGSIERLSIAEKEQNKGVVLASLPEESGRLQTRFLPLPATPFHDICISDPRRELPLLRTRYPEASTALVRCHIRSRHGEDNLYEILSEISRIFPRCYERTWSERRTTGSGGGGVLSTGSPCPGDARPAGRNEAAPTDRETWPDAGQSLRQLVIDYLSARLADDADREALLSLAQQLVEELD